MASYSVIWCDGDSAGLKCVCGSDTDADTEGGVCSDCGRRYTLTSYITVQEPVARCAREECQDWVYRTSDGRSAKRIYCTPACYERAQHLRVKVS